MESLLFSPRRRRKAMIVKMQPPCAAGEAGRDTVGREYFWERHMRELIVSMESKKVGRRRRDMMSEFIYC